MHRRSLPSLTLLIVALVALACAPKKPAATPQPAPPSSGPTAAPSAPPAPPRAPQRVDDVQPIAEPVLREDTIANRSLDDLNRDSPFKPAFFGLDSSDLDDTGRAVVSANAEILKRDIDQALDRGYRVVISDVWTWSEADLRGQLVVGEAAVRLKRLKQLYVESIHARTTQPI